jgi:outer membrane protein OmpA-like peptidoglycan-associated protein
MRPIPVQFVYAETTLTNKGKDTAEKLVKYLGREKTNRVTLIDHIDHVGGDKINRRVDFAVDSEVSRAYLCD